MTEKTTLKPDDPRLTPSIGLVFVIILVYTILEVALLLSTQSVFESEMGKISAHIVASLVLICLIGYLLQNRKIDARYLLVFGLFVVTLGPFGALTILLSIILYLVYVKITQPFGDLISSLFPNIEQDASDVAYERIVYHLDDFHPERIPIPFKDIMVFGTYKQKRMAIEKMLRYYHPEFAPALKAGLEDKSSAVKVQAATAMNYIDHKLFDANMDLKKNWEENLDDPIAIRNYAEHTEQYILAEILDPDRHQKMLQEAIRAYEAYLKKVPDDVQASYALANLFHMQGNYFAAKNILEELLDKQYSSKAALLMMTTLYQLKETDKLHEFALAIKDKLGEHPVHDQLYQAVMFWTEGLSNDFTKMRGSYA